MFLDHSKILLRQVLWQYLSDGSSTFGARSAMINIKRWLKIFRRTSVMLHSSSLCARNASDCCRLTVVYTSCACAHLDSPIQVRPVICLFVCLFVGSRAPEAVEASPY